MMTRRTNLLAGALACTVVVLWLAGTALASVPGGTTVTGALKAGTYMSFNATIDGVPITVTCPSFASRGTVPSGSPYTMDVSDPSISGCTDSLAGSDTITTNDTNGPWTLRESKTKPYTMTLTIPKDGAIFTTTILSSCKVIAAPDGPVGLEGKYNAGRSSDKVSKAKLSVKGSGCNASTALTSATFVFSPTLGRPPF